jgi:hypothetical protein
MVKLIQSFHFTETGLCLLMLLLCSLVNADDPGEVGKYYECKDLRGNISFQQQPCSGTNVKETSKVLPTAKPMVSSTDKKTGDVSVASVTNAITSLVSTTDHTSSKLAPLLQTPDAVAEQFKQRLQIAKEQKPVVLAACLILMLIAVWYAVVLVYLAFRQSIFWGLGYLFIPLVGMIYIVLHWDDAGKPFLISVGCGLLTGIILGVYL